MTALALAGTGGGSVAPDLVLPPGFDRIGDVVRFEQDYREKRPSGELDGDCVLAGVDPCKVKGATPSPGTDRREAIVVERPGRIGLPGTVASIDEQLAALRPETGARVRRYLASRGTLRAFCAAEGIHEMSFRVSLDRVIRRGGPLAQAIDARKDNRGHFTDLDLVPCTRCGLRGHLAGDPDRCLFYRGSLGLGGQAAKAGDEAGWTWAGRGE